MKLGYTVIPLVLRFRTYLPSRMNHRTTYQTKIIPLEPMVLIHRCVSRTIFWKYIQDTDIHNCSGRLKQSCLGQDKNLREWEKKQPITHLKLESLHWANLWMFPTAVTVGFQSLGRLVGCGLLAMPKTATEPSQERWNPGTLKLRCWATKLAYFAIRSLAKLSFGWLSSSALSWLVPLPRQRRELSPVPKPLFSARTFAACERSRLAALGRAQLITSWCGCGPSNRAPGLKTSRIRGRSGDSGDGLKTLWFSTTERWSCRFASI